MDTLEIVKIGDIYTNRMRGKTRRITFRDPKNKKTVELYMHAAHAGHGYWHDIVKDMYKAKIPGRIETIELSLELINSVPSFENVKIQHFEPRGNFVIFEYSDLNKKGEIQLALKDQLWRYIIAPDRPFDISEIKGDEFTK